MGSEGYSTYRSSGLRTPREGTLGTLSASHIATDPAGCREVSAEVRLRDIEPDDLPVFYEQQLDGDAGGYSPQRHRDTERDGGFERNE